MAGDSEMGSTSLQVRLELLHLSRECADLFRYSCFILKVPAVKHCLVVTPLISPEFCGPVNG